LAKRENTFLVKKFEIIIKTLHGLEEVLAQEVKEKFGERAEKLTILKRAISVEGDKKLLYEANLHLRTAIKVLIPILDFRAKTEAELYKSVQRIDWSKYLTFKDTLSVDGVVNSQYFNHSGYVALKAKDAIVDQFRKNSGIRPSVNTTDPTVRVNIHISEDSGTISLDSSDEPLYKRGYRVDTISAPLNEVLAAGMIQLSGWNRESTFIDAMCGSGTLPIEAAMLCANIPPNFYRKEFGFQRWKDFDNLFWAEIIEDAKRSIEKNKSFPQILGVDVSRKSFRKTIENSHHAFLREMITAKVCAFEEFEPPYASSGATLIINPPYGERLKKEDIENFYGMIGNRLKHHFSGYNVWILSGNFEAIKKIGLRPCKKYSLYNGSIECKFLGFSMYDGSRKQKDISDF